MGGNCIVTEVTVTSMGTVESPHNAVYFGMISHLE